MYMNTTVTVDDKGRMGIPAATGVEENDDLSIIDCIYYYEIKNTKEVDRVMDELIKEINDEKDFAKREELEKVLFNLSKRVLTHSCVDKQRRLLTSNTLEKGTYQVIGSRASIYLLKDKRER